MNNRTIDWMAIEHEYVTGKDGYRAIAEKHGIKKTRIAEVAKQENWVAKREAWRRKTAEQALNAASTREVRRLEKLRESADDLADMLREVTRDKKAFYYNNELSVNRIQAVAATLKDVAAITRNLYGLPTQAESAAQQIARERLALERERLELEKARAVGVDESDTGVVMLPEVEEEIEPASEAMQEAVGS